MGSVEVSGGQQMEIQELRAGEHAKNKAGQQNSSTIILGGGQRNLASKVIRIV